MRVKINPSARSFTNNILQSSATIILIYYIEYFEIRQMRFETEGQVEVRVEWCQQEQTVNSEADFNYIKMWLLQKKKEKIDHK